MASCADYLDIVPDDVPTMDNAFTNRISAEKFLFTCYSYLPNPAHQWTYPAMVGGDEMWWNPNQASFNEISACKIAMGNQNSNDPYHNFWDGRHNGVNLFTAIRDCNIFLENIHNPRDLEAYERIVWESEVKFLKAYYHLFLLQLYGPIPVIRENIPVSASPEQIRVYRDPVDDVVDYIVELLDEAAIDLPDRIESTITDAGRITRPIALAVKAKALVWAASPLFNGNPDYINLKDNRGIQLISPERDVAKWARAATAIKEAIDAAEAEGYGLYEFTPPRQMSDETRLKFELRGAVTDKFNREIVWPSTQNVDVIQRISMPHLVLGNFGNSTSELGATLKIAEQFYTANGIPIDEDPEWDYQNRYGTQVATADHQYYIKTGETSANLNFNREPRFYASLGFDRGIFEGSGQTNEADFWFLQARKSEIAGYRGVGGLVPTGYFMKKLIHVETVTGASNNTYVQKRYSFPLIRMSDLYLLYAEVLNEMKTVPDAEVYRWIDMVRRRAGLKEVTDSWRQSVNPNKPSTQEGMREIIHQERLIELAFEGQRFFDLRRWKKAMKYYNEPVQGWDYKGETIESYYVVTTYMNTRIYGTKDYLWPLKLSTVINNSNLVQNPGWK
jgi:hypothetical protein